MSPLASLMSVLFIIFYMFALIGMALFGGKIRKDEPVFLVD